MHEHIPSSGRRLRVGLLFSGYGGLDLAVEHVFNAETIWFSEINEPIARVFTHHRPDAPNLGDITTIDWSTVPSVDILCGGFPCTSVSTVGKRAGIAPDTQSGLWAHMATAIEHLQPEFVVIENVRGLLSSPAVRPSLEGDHDEQRNPESATAVATPSHATPGEVEPDPWHLGDQPTRPLRAAGRVLADLAQLGFDAGWLGLPASAIGAPHHRFRVFILAWRTVADPAGLRLIPRRGEHGTSQGSTRDDRTIASDHRSRPARTAWLTETEQGLRDLVVPDRGHLRRWGRYAHAIRRWEHLTGREAPAPALLSETSGPRPAPVFVEWLMGLDPGWVTDPTHDLTQNQQITALGNGVLPAQAIAALNALCDPRTPH